MISPDYIQHIVRAAAGPDTTYSIRLHATKITYEAASNNLLQYKLLPRLQY